MKTKIYFLMILAGVLIGCQQEPGYMDRTIENSEKILDDFGPLMEIVFSENNNFQSLHEYYQEVKNSGRTDANHENLRSKIISHMTLCKDKLQDQDDPKIIEFYVHEIMSMKYINDMGLLATLLDKLDSYWESEQIRSTAEHAYKKNMQYINDNFVDPDKVLKYQGDGTDRLKTLAQI